MTRVISVPRLGRTAKMITRAVEEASRDAAQALPADITDQLEVGRKPSSGAPQPALAESTLRQKRAKGQPETPGVATGLMSDERRWRVDFEGLSQTRVRPPEERLDALALQRREDPFEFVGVPERWLDETLPDAVKDQLSRVKGSGGG